MYAELHALSNFSFLKGASQPDELVQRAATLGYSALAMTDECSVAGVVRAHRAAKALGLHLIVGTELRCDDGLTLIALAQTRRGYAHLSRLITRARRAAGKGEYYLRRVDLQDALHECCLIWLPQRADQDSDGAWLLEHFPDRVWIGVELQRTGRDAEWLQAMELLGARLRMPVTACGGVLMHERARRTLQDVLTAIRLNKPLAQCGYELQASGERHLRDIPTLQGLYPEALLAESVNIARRCTFSLDELRYEYPRELVPENETPSSYLRKLTYAGARRHWPDGMPLKVKRLLTRELKLIRELRYESYFLTVEDLVREAGRRKILCQGRGSAANSAVCYCLGVTAVDPGRQEVLFERFISKERDEPPDIDIDFEHERREEIIQYIYDKYGRHRAGIAATVITYGLRSALRDVGKAMGLDVLQIEPLVQAFKRRPQQPTGDQVASWLRQAGFDPNSAVIAHTMNLAWQIMGFPRHLSQHVGGFVIAATNLEDLVPIENASMPGRTVIQWDKEDLESLGLLKVDVLALGMLTVIRRALDFYNDRHSKQLTLSSIPPDDPRVYEMICKADTIGVFQIESRAQMSMLPRLQPRRFYDLVIEIAIVRPGPIQGDMVHPYLRRRNNLEPIEYPSKKVEKILERTLGVPIFQEQAMQLAIDAAGFTPGQADELRRAMATWKHSGTLKRFQDRLFRGLRENGYTQEFAERLLKQIEGFGEYGFPESHSASFALLAYASAWLKHHAPAEFTAALLNSQPMGFYQPAQLLRDARDHGVEVRPVDVRASDWDCTLEPDVLNVGRASARLFIRNVGLKSDLQRTDTTCSELLTQDTDETAKPALRLGLRLVKGFAEEAAKRLMRARQEKPFADAQDLALRAQLRSRDLEALAAADALAGLSGNRHQAAWTLAGIDTQLPLFAQTSPREAMPLLRPPTEGQNILADYRSLGLTLRRHPLALLRHRLLRKHLLNASQLREMPHDTSVRTAGLVLLRQNPGTAKNTTFMTLEDETGQVNIIVWQHVAQRHRQAFLQSQLLEVHGQLQHQSGVMHVIAEKLVDRSSWLGGLRIEARDFH